LGLIRVSNGFDIKETEKGCLTSFKQDKTDWMSSSASTCSSASGKTIAESLKDSMMNLARNEEKDAKRFKEKIISIPSGLDGDMAQWLAVTEEKEDLESEASIITLDTVTDDFEEMYMDEGLEEVQEDHVMVNKDDVSKWICSSYF
jgi:hypothetical protein